MKKLKFVKIFMPHWKLTVCCLGLSSQWTFWWKH